MLEKSLYKLGLTPQRNNEGMNNRMIESVTLLFDGSERSIKRLLYAQKEYYSGKKQYTIKNNLMVDMNGEVLFRAPHTEAVFMIKDMQFRASGILK